MKEFFLEKEQEETNPIIKMISKAIIGGLAGQGMVEVVEMLEEAKIRIDEIKRELANKI